MSWDTLLSQTAKVLALFYANHPAAANCNMAAGAMLYGGVMRTRHDFSTEMVSAWQLVVA